MPFAASLMTGLAVITGVGGARTDLSVDAAMVSLELIIYLSLAATIGDGEVAVRKADAGVEREATTRKAKVFIGG